MANKITKKDNFRMIMEVLEKQGRTDLVEVMAHEIELLEKKASNKTQTKTQLANEEIKNLIISELVRLAKPVTITELIAQSPMVAEKTGSSNQKVSALITQLKNIGKITRLQEGKKAMFVVSEDIGE